jgi:nucleoside-diphosphate-sugar epimerase
MAQRICVTGAAGLAGRAVVTELREHGYDVTPTDVTVSLADRENGMLRADLTDYGQAVEALTGVDAVVHLANIPVFPDVKLTHDVGEFDTLLAIDRARQVLGFEPRHSWRDHVSATAAP